MQRTKLKILENYRLSFSCNYFCGRGLTPNTNTVAHTLMVLSLHGVLCLRVCPCVVLFHSGTGNNNFGAVTRISERVKKKTKKPRLSHFRPACGMGTACSPDALGAPRVKTENVTACSLDFWGVKFASFLMSPQLRLKTDQTVSRNSSKSHHLFSKAEWSGMP